MKFPVAPDFSLVSGEERANFILSAIQRYGTNMEELPASEVTLITQYLLFGLRKDGTTLVGRNGSYFVNSRTTPNVEDQPPNPNNVNFLSVDDLIDESDPNAGSNIDTAFAPVASMDGSAASPRTPYLVPKKAPAWRELYGDDPDFQPLFDTIDRIRFILDTYNDKDPVPPEKFSPELIAKLRAVAASLTLQQSIQYKRILIEAQRDQYVMRDSKDPRHLHAYRTTEDTYSIANASILWNEEESDFAFLPMGLLYKDSHLSRSLFYNNCHPELPDLPLTKEDLKYAIDFRNPRHLTAIIKAVPLLLTETDKLNSNCAAIIDTLEFYAASALKEKNPKYYDIYVLYTRNTPLTLIAALINTKYGKNHTVSYISALFSKACDAITEFVDYHYREYCDRKNKLRWQRCDRCGRILYRHEFNFCRRSQSSTGFNSVCHDCEHKRAAVRKATPKGQEMPPLVKVDPKIVFLPYKEDSTL